MIFSLKDIATITGHTGEAKELEWLYHEILSSLPKEVLEEAQIRQEVNVQLMIDNVVVEPVVLNDVLSNLNKYIDQQAEEKVKDKFEQLELQFQDIMEPLEIATKDATSKIKEKFNIVDEE